MGHAALGGMDGGTAQFFLGDLFADDALDDSRAGQEHIRGILDHQGKIGQGGGVDGSAGAGSENAGNLRDHARSQNVPFENLAVSGQGVNSFLDACAAGIVQPDDGSAVADSHVHHLADFLGHGLGERPAGNREVLGEHIDQTAVNRAAAGHDAVTVVVLLVHAEMGAAVLYEHIIFFETAFVQKQGDAFPRCELAFLMLGFHAFLSAAQPGFGPPVDQFLDVLLLNVHGIVSS